MGKSPSWEAPFLSAIADIIGLLQKFHYCVHKGLPLDPVWRQVIPFQILTSYVLKYILILSSDLHLCSSGFQANILCAYVLLAMFVLQPGLWLY